MYSPIAPATLNMLMRAKKEAAYNVVAEQARGYLRTLPVGDYVSTKELAEAIYPARFAVGDAGNDARQTIFRALQFLADRGLSDCATKGAERVSGRIRGRPNLWHAPDGTAGTIRCPQCGTDFIPAGTIGPHDPPADSTLQASSATETQEP